METTGPPEDRFWDGLPRATWWWGIGIAVLTVGAYAQVVNQGFVTPDDRAFLIQNSMVNRGLTWEGIGWAFTTFYDFNYNPIAWLSAMIDVSLFGLNANHAGPQKAMSVLLHIMAMWALLLTLVRATGCVWRSGLVAALFALHPLHVEPITWVIARKDVLGALFAFLAMLAYVRYVERRGFWRYSAVVILTAAAMLSKATFVTLPCVLMLMDFWPLRRWPKSRQGVQANVDVKPERNKASARPLGLLVLEKAPMLGLSALTGVLAFKARQSADHGIQSLDALPMSERLGNAAASYVRYLGKTFWPADLSCIYSMPVWSTWQVVGAAVIVATITALSLAYAKRTPWALMGWLFFLGTLVPVIGIIQVGAVSITDRYTYFPLTGVFIVMAWSLPELCVATSGRRRATGAAIAALLAAMVVATHRQVAFWSDERTLIFHTLELEPDLPENIGNVCGLLISEGKAEEAMKWSTKLINLKPRRATGYLAQGKALEMMGRLDDAESFYRQGIATGSDGIKARALLASLLLQLGRHDEAISELEKSVQMAPNNADASRDLATVLFRMGKNERAAAVLEHVLMLDPNDVKSMINLGVCLDRLGRPAEAVVLLKRAVEIRPQSTEARENLGAVYAQLGRLQDASMQYQWLVEHPSKEPGSVAMAYHRLGLLCGQMGQTANAISYLRHAAELTSEAEVHNDFGVALAQQGEFSQASSEFSAALKADPNHAGAKANLAKAESLLQRQAPTPLRPR